MFATINLSVTGANKMTISEINKFKKTAMWPNELNKMEEFVEELIVDLQCLSPSLTRSESLLSREMLELGYIAAFMILEDKIIDRG